MSIQKNVLFVLCTIGIFFLVIWLTIYVDIFWSMLISGLIILVIRWAEFIQVDSKITPKRMKKEFVMIIFLIIIATFVQYSDFQKTSNEGSYYLADEPSKEDEYPATIFYTLSSQTRLANGSWSYLQNPIPIPTDDYFYHERNNTDTQLRYTINFSTTLRYSNITLKVYGDDNIFTNQHTLLRTYTYTDFTTYMKTVDMVPTIIYTKLINLDFMVYEDEPHAVIQFYIELNMDLVFYDGLEINYAHHWVNINNIEKDGTWGITLSQDYSLDWSKSTLFAQMTLVSALFIGIYLLVFMISFFTQNTKILKTFFVLMVVLAGIMYFYWFAQVRLTDTYQDFMKSILSLKGLMVGESNMSKRIFVSIMEILYYVFYTVLYIITIAKALAVCAAMGLFVLKNLDVED